MLVPARAHSLWLCSSRQDQLLSFHAAGVDAAGVDAAGVDAGMEAGMDAGIDAGIDGAGIVGALNQMASR